MNDHPDIIVSNPAESDLPLILEIEFESQPEPWTKNSFAEELARGSLFVARTDASAPTRSLAIAGYICFWPVSDEIQILNLAVSPAMRRKGIARELLSFAIATGRDRHAATASLEVRQSNLAARRLYESLGFRTVAERPGYYGTRSESAILMELDIP